MGLSNNDLRYAASFIEPSIGKSILFEKAKNKRIMKQVHFLELSCAMFLVPFLFFSS